MARPTEYEITFITDNPAAVEELTGNERSGQTEMTIAPGLTLRANDVRQQAGVDATTIIMDFTLKVGVGVASKVISDFLLDLIKRHKGRLKINGEPVDGSDPKSLEQKVSNKTHG
jgi:hypothetical protein